MPHATLEGVSLRYELEGEGEPIALVHGSWGDHHNWDLVAPKLARSFRVLRYDRRGHSESTFDGPQYVKEDLADLAGLIRHFDLAPAHVVGNSFGGTLVLKLAAKEPTLFRTLTVHEPPIVGLLEGDPLLEAAGARMRAVADLLRIGEMEAGAKLFVETVGLGPGAWDELPQLQKDTFVRNARTWLDEIDDPETFTIDLDGLGRFDKPALLTAGDKSPPIFAPILEKIHAAMPTSRAMTIAGVGHVPHITRPDDWVDRVTRFARGVLSASMKESETCSLTLA